jgi:hypothetical protein
MRNDDFIFGLGVVFGLTACALLAAAFDLPALGSIRSAFSAIPIFWLLAWLVYRVGAWAFKRNLPTRSAFLLGVLSGIIQIAVAAGFVFFASPNGEVAGLLAYLFLIFPILACSLLFPLTGRKATIQANQ